MQAGGFLCKGPPAAFFCADFAENGAMFNDDGESGIWSAFRGNIKCFAVTGEGLGATNTSEGGY